jgi:ribosomal-protein-alanine N-acetyltransferase
VRVRRANPADISAMIDLEGQSASAAHWSRSQYDALFVTASGQPSERLAWVAEDESGAAWIYAFLVARRVDAEWELENIVVDGTARRRGVGTLLLRELVEHAKAERGSGIFLEVRESNQGARALYQKFGFEETGLRKSYYPNPPEDAILYQLSLY